MFSVNFILARKEDEVMSARAFNSPQGVVGRLVGLGLGLWGSGKLLAAFFQSSELKSTIDVVYFGVSGQMVVRKIHDKNAAMASPKNKIKVAWSIDFDAISGWLGTGANPKNSTADYSAGYFSASVGVPRLLKLFKKLGIADKVTWCIPGHSIETFPEQTRNIVASGAEIALHGYAHESASQMTAVQERDVLRKCIQLVEGLTGKKPRGYRAPLYQLQERTISILQNHDFLWDSSLSHFDSVPYLLPKDPAPIVPIDFSPSAKAEEWMQPSPNWEKLAKSDLVEIPANWYSEDMTPLQFFPNTPNSAGYVDVRVVERMWMDRSEWLRSEIADGRDDMTVFSIIIHPETSGMAHVIGMIERFLRWIQSFGENEVEFLTYEQIAEEWRSSQRRDVSSMG